VASEISGVKMEDTEEGKKGRCVAEMPASLDKWTTAVRNRKICHDLPTPTGFFLALRRSWTVVPRPVSEALVASDPGAGRDLAGAGWRDCGHSCHLAKPRAPLKL
jgi:hypothetical protein